MAVLRGVELQPTWQEIDTSRQSPRFVVFMAAGCEDANCSRRGRRIELSSSLFALLFMAAKSPGATNVVLEHLSSSSSALLLMVASVRSANVAGESSLQALSSPCFSWLSGIEIAANVAQGIDAIRQSPRFVVSWLPLHWHFKPTWFGD
ncbi:hypothetical protein V493_04722 [Pseudogymnoascus sp. VKM F-4281 (FW-2241)]|nr:hypothetical protein V493_04722 [Pseudogymnoascus sp. VKM F-4281 (FW-2241)]